MTKTRKTDTNGMTIPANLTRKWYALHWRKGYEFECAYNTIPEMPVEVAYVLIFGSKESRDEYVDRWHSAESVSAPIATRLIRMGVSHYYMGR